MLMGDKSQPAFWWLALARRMYQTDCVARTCLLCYSYHKPLRVPRRCCFCCASVFLAFPFALGRIMFTAFMLNRFVLSHLSPGGRTTPLFFATGSFFAKFVSLSLCAHCV